MAGSLSQIRALASCERQLLQGVLELNQSHMAELSALDGVRLAQLIDTAFYASIAGDADAFLISFDQDAEYDSPNFKWFRSRYARFVYVDRIAVAGRSRAQGLASQLYRALFEAARAAGHSVIACEVNVDPPNPASDAFHASWGFEEVGTSRLNSAKSVRYLIKQV